MAADLTGTQFLRLGRKAEERIDLSVGKKLHWGRTGARDPVDILGRIEADMGGHRRDECVLVDTSALYADLLALQIPNGADAFIGKQFEAADMHAGKHRDGFAGINRG